ncbi:RNA-binding protein [archaeon]|nr:RNA-binding protein [archaeon]|tara:strand:+ start:4267 stop:4965 length:699 start_codon:yes stop_codon:yes gene_type:complete
MNEETNLLIKPREVVVPGQVLAKGMDNLPSDGTYREGEEIISNKLGLVNVDGRVIKVISLTGAYVPKEDDIVIGKVVEIGFSGWFVDVGSANDANLSLRDVEDYVERGADLTKYFDFDEILIAKVVKVTRFKSIDITMKAQGLRKIKGGKIIEITPSKVPRVIGKQGSMISMIKEHTNCEITVGQNGRVWIQGSNVEDEILATKAIMKIESSSHVNGLTEIIETLLKEGTKK